MAWNPSPKVAAARDYGKRFGASQVIILEFSRDDDYYCIVSYGKTKGLCADAEGMAKKIENFIAGGGLG